MTLACTVDPNINNYNDNWPIWPLREMDKYTTDQCSAHGLKGYPPKSGDLTFLPARGTYRGELGCNRSGTKLRDPSVTEPFDGHASAVGPPKMKFVQMVRDPMASARYTSLNRYNETVDNKWFGGTSLAIAYTSDVNSLKPNDFTVISVNKKCVCYREIDWDIPDLPTCPPGGCLYT